jgi:hypothetical protein
MHKVVAFLFFPALAKLLQQRRSFRLLSAPRHVATTLTSRIFLSFHTFKEPLRFLLPEWQTLAGTLHIVITTSRLPPVNLRYSTMA